MELIQRCANRDDGCHGQAWCGSIGGWNPKGKSSIDLVAQFVGGRGWQIGLPSSEVIRRAAVDTTG
jgi:hypothetical protein